jgi:hypothetical protein
MDSEASIDLHSNWKCEDFPFDESRFVLSNQSNIEDKNENKMGSWIKRKQFDTANAIILQKIYISQSENVSNNFSLGIFFRYYDDSNYYMLKIYKDPISKVSIYKIISG